MKFEKPSMEIIYLDPANLISTSTCTSYKTSTDEPAETEKTCISGYEQ